ncbi:MAG: DNA-binding protein [Thiohalocapsa sp.]|uniref:FitA-like ribbon-helix-helix domain-containing protein n=1 Tax=Thiohalocapsa sp. TaxID=2497641 RepID=UPI0025D8B8CC|nr:DNA-binding protein [Thiohalocapsa sp.]MCG6942453.1 DNA-binding protein [Thiohalocapsa sp.]
MASLVVRNLDPDVVAALKQRAAASGHSAEAEHRLILEQALLRPRKCSFAEVLSAMPDVGQDGDFERIDAAEPAAGVLD